MLNSGSASKITVFKAVQLQKTPFPRTIEWGIVISSKLTHSSNAESPISFTFPGILIALSTLHPLNAFSQIELNVSGKRIYFKFLK